MKKSVENTQYKTENCRPNNSDLSFNKNKNKNNEKIEIVEHVINNTTISRSQAIQAVDCAFDAIEKALCKGESVYIRGFGTIKTYITKERKARNIYKRTTVIIPARRTVKLVVSKQLKEK